MLRVGQVASRASRARARPLSAAAAQSSAIKASSSVLEDARRITRRALAKLEGKKGRHSLAFPKSVVWLAGAPGAGKGTMTPFIQEATGLQTRPLEVSSLLDTPDNRKLKDAGQLIGDLEVVEALFETLLLPQYKNGLIVDGFPRTETQALCIRLLRDEMVNLRLEYQGTPYQKDFRRPVFHVGVLYVSENESIRRQMSRGQEVAANNERFAATGVGKLMEVRATDMSAAAARERYRVFREQVYNSLLCIKDDFNFHFINAEGDKDDVAQRVVAEFEYQSAMELGEDTYDTVRRFPTSAELTENSRVQLVRRLDQYQREHTELFDQVMTLLLDQFLGILRRQALAGEAIIRSEDPILDSPLAIDMILDVMIDRGYVVVLDVQWTASHTTQRDRKVWSFHVTFPRQKMRPES